MEKVELQRPHTARVGGLRCVDECLSIMLMPCLCTAGILSCLSATAFLWRAQYHATKDRPVVAQSVSMARVVHSPEQPSSGEKSGPIMAWIRDPDNAVEPGALDCRVVEDPS